MFSWRKNPKEPEKIEFYPIISPSTNLLNTYPSYLGITVTRIDDEARYVVLTSEFFGRQEKYPVAAFKFRREAEDHIKKHFRDKEAFICEIVAKSCPQPPLVKDVT